MHFKLANLLHEHDIHPISMSSDGAEVERATQRIIAESAPSYRIYVITNPIPGCQLELRIPLYFGQHPKIMTQDSEHGLKTARNQIHTGARILVLAFFVILFAHLRELALNIAGPLFTRDVEKVDKQDDRAAARVFSASTLEFLFKYHPDHVGLAVYLFVLGELVDAWQNRSISHRERAKMVLRARFFLMAWRSHIVAHPDYSFQTQFISRESYDIFLTLCDGLLSLIIAYRHYYPTYPLLPYLSRAQFWGQAGGCTLLSVGKKNRNKSEKILKGRSYRCVWPPDLTPTPTAHLQQRQVKVTCSGDCPQRYFAFCMPGTDGIKIFYTQKDRKGQIYLPESFRICLDFFFYTQKCTATSLPPELSPR
jgi:hypothetical protein